MNDQPVLLVHGLAETSLCMMPMAAALTLSGYNPSFASYPSTALPVEELTEIYLGQAVRSLTEKPLFHVVTHSMGGIMIRYYLQRHKIHNIGRVVMLAPANKGSPMFSLYRHHPLFPWIFGEAGIQSADDECCFACQIPDEMPVETGIIAGGLASDPLSWLLMPWPHDGRTTAEGTKLMGMKDHMILPAGHDMMMLDPFVWFQTAHFLHHGNFFR